MDRLKGIFDILDQEMHFEWADLIFIPAEIKSKYFPLHFRNTSRLKWFKINQEAKIFKIGHSSLPLLVLCITIAIGP